MSRDGESGASGKRADTESRRQRKKQLLKLSLAALTAVSLCTWVAYRWFYPPSEQTHDFAIDSAMAWLENADRQKFEVCRKDVVDDSGWFDWFVKDRTSLGKKRFRELYSRQEVPGAAAGRKRYEVKFDVRFQASPGDNLERVLVETDGAKEFKVCGADYWFSHGTRYSGLPLTESKKKQMMAAAATVLAKFDAGDDAFFRRAYREECQRPDYLNAHKYHGEKWSQRLLTALKNGRAKPWQYVNCNGAVPAGRTGLELGFVYYRLAVNSGTGPVKDYWLLLLMQRDGYRDGDRAEWLFSEVRFWEARKSKK